MRQQHWTEETAALDRRDSNIGQKRQQHWTEETAVLDRRDSSIGQKRQQHWTEETVALSNAAVSSVQCCQCFLFVLSCYVNHFSYVVKTLDDDINIQSNLNTKATQRPLKGHSKAIQMQLKGT
jgi:hypothetical protein